MPATQVTVTGKFQSRPGVASSGNLQWQLSSDLFDSAGHIVATTEPVPVRLDSTGSFSVVLLANDDSASTPIGTYWTLSGEVDGQRFTESYVISHTLAPTVDISALTPASPSNPLFPVNAVELQGVPVDSAAPADGAVMTYSAATGRWHPLLGAYVGVVAAVGTSSAGGDAASLNTAINAASTAGGGTVKGKAGSTYYLEGSIVPKSNVTLDMTGCTVQAISTLTTNMVANAAVTAVATATDGATTSGSNVITTSLGAQAVAGQTLVVAAAGGNGNGPLVGKVASATSTTITLNTLDGRACNATATIASGATVTLYNRDSNIKILGGIWNQGSATTTGLQFGAIFLRHIDGLTVDIEQFNSSVSTRGVVAADVTNYWCRIKGGSSGGVMNFLLGPAFEGRLDYTAGTSGDDFVTLQAADYPTHQDSAGDITEVTIGTISGASTTNLLKILAGAGRLIDGIKVDGGVFGSATQQGVYLGDDASQASTTGGTYGTIDLGFVKVTPSASTSPVYLVSPAADRIKVTVRDDFSGRSGSPQAINVAGTSTATIGVLELVDCDIPVVSSITGGRIVFVNRSTVTIGHLLLRGCQQTNTTDNSGVVVAAGTVNLITLENHRRNVTVGTTVGVDVYVQGGTVTAVNVIGGYFNNGGSVVRVSGGTLSTAKFAGCYINAYSRAMQSSVAGTITIELANPTLANLTNGQFYASSASLVVTGAATIVGSQPLVARAATESLRVNGTTLPADLSILTPADNDIANNTNSGLACGTGVAIHHTGGTGNGWKNIYSGTTY